MTTHNGRGQDGTSGSAGDPLPASTTPYEGVVLPANGEPWTPQQQREAQAERDRVSPPAGQPWGQPWGPDSAPASQHSPGYWGPPGGEADPGAGQLDAGAHTAGPGALPSGGGAYGGGPEAGAYGGGPGAYGGAPDAGSYGGPAATSYGAQGDAAYGGSGDPAYGGGPGAYGGAPDAGSYGSAAPSAGGTYGGPGVAQPLPPEGTPARPPHPPSMPPAQGAGPGAMPQPAPTGPPVPGAPHGPGGYAQPPGAHAAPHAPGPGQQPGATPYGQQQPGTGAGPLPQPGAPGGYPPAPGGPPAPDAYPPAAGGPGQPQAGGAPQAGGGPYAGPAGAHASGPGPLPQEPPASRGRHALPQTGQAPQLPAQAGNHPKYPSAPPAPQPQGAGPDSEATQFFPPFPAGDPQGHAAVSAGSEDGTQLLPPQPAGPVGGPDSEATQFIAPVPGGGEATQMLPTPEPPADGAPSGPAGSGERRPLPEFESLFRAEPGQSAPPSAPGAGPRGTGDDEPGSTQNLPLFDHASEQQAPPRGGYGYPQPGSGPRGGYGYPQQPGGGQLSGYGYPQPGSEQHEPQGGRAAARRGGDRGRRQVPSGVLIAGGLAGVAVIGLVVGGLLLAGGGSGGGEDKPQPSSEPAGEESSKAPDPAEAQAKKLDALLADSNNSRAAVIRSVENIKQCKALDKAAKDLRAAARQRTGLVRRLGELKTNEIPDSGQLTTALTSAWKSSASADNHYAAWADQAGGKKGCHKGKAKPTKQTAQGNTASGTATTAKKKAAGLWNPTAKKYGLTERQFGQL
ncbi:hypothetical protein [Streptomyces reniochalinae]|uniref:hypothetical protein n=1 Tax=Streptomyces reniochalinae TaxID=2250578 RepID=UPI0015F10B8B|nr:hypothetical protein [Streptomyces reniochalinae]